MALLTRRTLLATGTVLAAAASGKPAGAQSAGGPQMDMRKLTDIVAVSPPKVLPATSFVSLDGKPVSLSGFLGKPVVLNFWATWCIPCVAELPELDKLAATGAFQVLAVSADRTGADVVRPFAAAHHIEHVTLLLDPGSDSLRGLNVEGFPTTLLINAAGRLCGSLEGPAAWGAAGPALTRLLG